MTARSPAARTTSGGALHDCKITGGATGRALDGDQDLLEGAEVDEAGTSEARYGYRSTSDHAYIRG